MAKTEWSWGAYFKATPANILFFVDGAKLLLGSISGVAYIENRADVAFFILVGVGVLDLASRFVARAKEDFDSQT